MKERAKRRTEIIRELAERYDEIRQFWGSAVRYLRRVVEEEKDRYLSQLAHALDVIKKLEKENPGIVAEIRQVSRKSDINAFVWLLENYKRFADGVQAAGFRGRRYAMLFGSMLALLRTIEEGRLVLTPIKHGSNLETSLEIISRHESGGDFRETVRRTLGPGKEHASKRSLLYQLHEKVGDEKMWRFVEGWKRVQSRRRRGHNFFK